MTFNKAVGPGQKSKINKARAYLYCGLQSILLALLWTFLHIWTFYDPIYIVQTFYSYGHFTLWTFSDSSNLYGHFITMDNLPYGFFTHRSVSLFSSHQPINVNRAQSLLIIKGKKIKHTLINHARQARQVKSTFSFFAIIWWGRTYPCFFIPPITT